MLFLNLQKLVLSEASKPIATVDMDIMHITTEENARDIARNGFSLSKFGQTSKKVGNTGYLAREPKGIFMLPVSNTSGRPAHPYDHSKRGAYVYGSVSFKNPLVINSGDKSWWDQLADKYPSKSGQALTKAIQSDGHDGVIVRTDGSPTTIIVFNPKSINVDEEKTLNAIN